jgi:2-phospho-L-lactate/phosphoenolpyruvate guanylyltransferase
MSSDFANIFSNWLKNRIIMRTFAIVPAKTFENAKTRLSLMLDVDERILLSSLLLDYTLDVLANAPSLSQVVVVSADKRAEEIAAKHGASFVREEKDNGVNSAVAIADRHCIQEEAEATIVIPQDLPLLDPTDISRASDIAKNESRCIVICPSLRFDGTNMLLRKPPSVIDTFYDHDSYNMHVKTAICIGIPVKLLFSKTVRYDLDTPEDAKHLVNEAKDVKTLKFLKLRF